MEDFRALGNVSFDQNKLIKLTDEKTILILVLLQNAFHNLLSFLQGLL